MRQFSLLFDLDGTLVDSDALHLKAFQEILKDCGVVDNAYYRSHIAGRPNNIILAEAFPSATPQHLNDLGTRKELLYRDGLATIQVVEGAYELLNWARSEDLRK